MYWSVVQSLEQRVGSLESSSNHMSRAWKRDTPFYPGNTLQHIASHCITGIVLGFSMFRYPIYTILPVCHLLECEHGCYNCNASAAFLLNHQGWMIAWENWRPVARNQPSFAQLLNSLEPGTNRATAASSIF